MAIKIQSTADIEFNGVKCIVFGGAGVGKTRFIEVLFESLERFYRSKPGINQDKQRVLLCAPTGTAAYNMHGQTMHSTFGLPFDQVSSPVELSSHVSNSMYAKLCDVELIIIDEVLLKSYCHFFSNY